VAHLVAELDDTLFASVLANDRHVLHNLLPDRNDCLYSRSLDVMIVRSPLGVTRETFLIYICLKTYITYQLVYVGLTTNFVSCVLSAVVFKD